MRGSRWRRRQLLILCYHGISIADEHEWRPGLYITPAQLAERIQSLRSLHATVLSLDEGLHRLHDGSLPDAAVAVTFDDGGHDFYVNALPQLEAAGLPATVYLTTYYCLLGGPIYSLAVDYLLWRGRANGLPPWPALGIEHPQSFPDRRSRETLTDRLVAATRGPDFSPARRAELLAELAARLGVEHTDLKRLNMLSIMSADEAADCAKRGVDLQLHTHRHRMPRDPGLLSRELEENRAVIRKLSGRDATHLCYPSGDYTPGQFAQLAESGISSATTCEVALASKASHPYALPRFLDTSGQSRAAFEGWVAGAAAIVSRKANVQSAAEA